MITSAHPAVKQGIVTREHDERIEWSSFDR
jgi:hypothetical protein